MTGGRSLTSGDDRTSRRLPYVVLPAEGESWWSWLDRGAAHVGVPVGVHALALGAQVRPHTVGVRPMFGGLLLTPDSRDALMQTTGLSQSRLDAMQLSAYGDTALSFQGVDLADESTVRLFASREWCQVAASRACPRCLRDQPVWKLWWRLGIAAVCPVHGVLLVDACSRCETPLRRGFTRHARGLSQVQMGDPGLCENALAGGRCRQTVADISTVPVGQDLIRAQTTALTVASGRQGRIVGTYVEPHEWFEAVKFLAALLRYSGALPLQPRGSDPDDAAYLRAVSDDYNAASAMSRLQSGALRGMPRTAAVAAGVLLAADWVLGANDPETCAARLDPMVHAAATRRRERGSANVLRRMPVLEPLRSIFLRLDVPGARVAGRVVKPSRDVELEFRHIPHLLNESDYRLLVAPHLPHTAPNSGRRLSSLAVARLAGARSWPQAAAELEMNPLYARRVSDTLVRRIHDPDQFWGAVAVVYQRICDRPLIDYRYRRLALASLQSIPAAVLREACGDRSCVITPARCGHAATWVWQQITQGDIREAPAYQQQVKSIERTSVRDEYRRFCHWLPIPAGQRLLIATAGPILAQVES